MTPTNIDKGALIERLLLEHHKIVSQALDNSYRLGEKRSLVLPDSVYQYTNMFLTNLKEIVMELK